MIGTADYRFITEVIAEAQDLGDEARDALFCVRTALLDADINPQDRFRRQLYAMLDNTYAFVVIKHSFPRNATTNFVKALNDHILEQYGNVYGYETLDEFLIDQYLQVPLTFAQLSRYIGYPVTESGDKAANWEDVDDNWQDVDLDYDKIGWENI